MNDNHFPPEQFPDVISAFAEIGNTFVETCHDPNLEQMQTKVDALINMGLLNAPFIAPTPEIAQAQEKLLRDGIHFLIAHTHNPDKDAMLATFHELSNVPPEKIIEFATKQIQEQTNPNTPQTPP